MYYTDPHTLCINNTFYTESDVEDMVCGAAEENVSNYRTKLDDSGIGVEEVKEDHDQTQCMII